MSIQCVQEQLRFEKVVAEGTAQVVIQAKKDIPESLPPIMGGQDCAILGKRAQARIENAVLFDDKAEISGHINIEVVYLTHGEGTKSAARVEYTDIPFSQTVSLPGAERGMRLLASVSVEDFDVDAVPPRSLNITAMLELSAKAVETCEETIVTDVRGLPADRVSVKRETLRVKQVVAETQASAKIFGSRNLPDEALPVSADDDAILCSMVSPRINEIRVGDDRVTVQGVLTLGIVYLADPDSCDVDMPMQCAQFKSIPFEQVITVAGVRPGDVAQIELMTEDTSIERVTGNVIQFDITLNMMMRVYRIIQVDAVTDIVSLTTDVIDLERQRICVTQVTGMEDADFTIRGMLDFPDDAPPVAMDAETPICGAMAEARVTDVKVMDNKVIVEGCLDIHVVYTSCIDGCKPKYPVYCVDFRCVRFEGQLDVVGATPEMKAYAKVAVQSIDVDRGKNDCSIDYVVVLDVDVVVKEERCLLVVINCEIVTPITQDPSIITYYMIQPGDTLWKIARRYGITMESIMRTNNIDDPSKIFVGQKLIIPA